MTDLKGAIPAARINATEVSVNYCSFSGNYMLLPLNLMNAQKAIRKMLKPRYSDILVNRSSVDCDTLIYNIPENYKYESVPPGTTINSKFGNYSCSISANQKEVIFIRKFTVLEGRYKPSDYKDFYEFVLSVSKADNLKIILTKIS